MPVAVNGFDRVPAAVWAHLGTIGRTGLLVYVAVCHRVSRRTGECWPSLADLARLVQLHERNVRKALRLLQGAGLLVVRERPGRSTIYRVPGLTSGVTPGAGARPQAPEPLSLPRAVVPGRASAPGVTGGAPACPAPGSSARLTRDKNQREEATPPSPAAPAAPAGQQGAFPGMESSASATATANRRRQAARRPRRMRASEVLIPPSIDTPEIREAWAKRIRQLAEKRSALGATAAAEQLAELARLGPDRALSALNHSIANNFTGLVEPGAYGGVGRSHSATMPTTSSKAGEEILARARSQAVRAGGAR